MQRQFRSLESFKKFAAKRGAKVRLVTKGKTNTYYQMLFEGYIVGYFNTAFGGMVRDTEFAEAREWAARKDNWSGREHNS